MSAAVALCRTPALASALFEAGGLGAVTAADLMNNKVQISPQGLPALEAPHPAILLSILEVLVAMTGALPTHRMVITDALNWVEQNHRVLLEMLQWVASLPIATAVEPRALDMNGLSSVVGNGDFGGALQSAAVVSTVVDMSAGSIQDSLLLVFCAGISNSSGEVSDMSLELSSLMLSGRFWVSDFNVDTQLEARDRIVALCYRCARMFSELFANLSVAAQRCSSNRGSVTFGQSSQQICGQIERLSSMFEPSLASLLTQMATAEPPRQRDTIMQDTGQNVGTSGSILEPSFPSQRNGNGNVSSCWRSLGDVSPPAQSDAGFVNALDLAVISGITAITPSQAQGAAIHLWLSRCQSGECNQTFHHGYEESEQVLRRPGHLQTDVRDDIEGVSRELPEVPGEGLQGGPELPACRDDEQLRPRL